MYKLLFCCLLTTLFNSSAVGQDDIFVMLRCYNYHNATGLAGKITAIFKTDQRFLGQCDKSGIVLLQIPDSTKYLLFEADGYITSKIAVNISGKIGKGDEFNLAVPLLLIDSASSTKMKPQEILSLSFDITENESVDFVMHDKKARSKSDYHFTVKKVMQSFFINDVLPGPYVMEASDKEGLLKSEEIIIKPGFNFKAVYVDKRKSYTEDSLKTLSPPAISSGISMKTLYFNQSSYELRAEVKMTLDSIAVILTKKSELNVIVTGFTDNVGRRHLNMALAEYRAKVVVNYLNQKGVKPQRVTAIWKGPDLAVAPNDSDKNKERNRRVEVKFGYK